MDSEQANSTIGQPRIGSCRYAGISCFLCLAFLLLNVALLLSIIFVILEVPDGLQSVSLRSLLIDVYRWVFAPVVVYLADILRSLFPWPILVIAVVALVAWGPGQIRELLSYAKLELPGGFKIEGRGSATDAFRKELGDAQKSVARANDEIEEAYESARAYVSQLRERFEVDKLSGELSLRVAETIGDGCPEDYRFTLYVPDLVFDDRLYQLVDYYDKRGHRTSPTKAGRTFSIRYGIIGRVWRSGVPEVEGDLISPEDRKQLGEHSDELTVERFIARRWGLTLEEAIDVRPYPSYGAVRIERAEKSLGVAFFYSKKTNAFGVSSDLATRIQAVVRDSALTRSLLEISREITPWSRIRIFKNS